MKRVLSKIASIFLIALSAMSVGISIKAADEDTVTATVTARNVSVSVTDGIVDYGELDTSSTQDTTSSGVNNTQNADNDGNVTEDFDIYDAGTTTSSGAGWTLGGSAGAETYTHKFCISDCDGTPSWVALTGTPQELVADLADTGDQDFDLQIGTPTSTSDYNEQTATVTVQASYYQ